MFEVASPPCPTADLRAWREQLTALALTPTTTTGAQSNGDRLARIAVLEDLRAAVAAAQAVEVAALVAERAAAVEVEIATVERPGVGRRRRREESARRTVAEIARARRISPWQASRFVAFAAAAPADLPQTWALLAGGRVSERRAMLMLNAVTPLGPDDRRRVDTELAPHVTGWGDRKVDRQARAAVYRLDPAGTVERNAYAVEQRRVSVRPAPECMAWLTALVPMPQAVAARAALEQAAREAKAAGDPRGRGAVMADTLIERVTGQTRADDVAVAVKLVITDRTLTGGDDPAHLDDGEPVPAPLARHLALGTSDHTDTRARRTVQRLFTDPAGRLVTAETTSRQFTAAMADLIRLRDGTCTTPWCDAPIRHIDHHDPHTRGGPTSTTNGRGLCQWCNQTKGNRPPDDPSSDERLAARPPRSHLERRLRRRIGRRCRQKARRRPVILVELPHDRCTMQQ